MIEESAKNYRQLIVHISISSPPYRQQPGRPAFSGFKAHPLACCILARAPIEPFPRVFSPPRARGSEGRLAWTFLAAVSSLMRKSFLNEHCLLPFLVGRRRDVSQSSKKKKASPSSFEPCCMLRQAVRLTPGELIRRRRMAQHGNSGILSSSPSYVRPPSSSRRPQQAGAGCRDGTTEWMRTL